MIDRGDVTVNGAARKASLRLREGDRVAVAIPVPADAPEKESAEGLVVLHEDDALVAIDKPSGVVAHPTGRIRHGTLINRLHARYRRTDPSGAPRSVGGAAGAGGAGPVERDVVPRLAHRLDKDTSGVVLVVKDRKLDAAVTRAFFRREVEKTYLALVVGDPATDGGLDRPADRPGAGRADPARDDGPRRRPALPDAVARPRALRALRVPRALAALRAHAPAARAPALDRPPHRRGPPLRRPSTGAPERLSARGPGVGGRHPARPAGAPRPPSRARRIR